MGKKNVTDLTLYRWRYVISFTALIVLIVALLATITFFSPGGLSHSEMNAAVTSSNVSMNDILHPSASSIIQLPHHFLQKASIDLFGVTTFSIKLPSLLMGIGAAMALYGVVRLWFRRNVAIITSMLSVTTGLYLLATQSGSPVISSIFWSCVVLFFAGMLARPSRLKPLWLVCLLLATGFSLYAPFQIYVLISLFATGLIHPHARYIISRQSKIILGIGIIGFGLIAAPLAVALFRAPSLGLSLIGWPDRLNFLAIWNHVAPYIDIYNMSSSAIMRPAYGLGILLLAAIGIYKLFTAKYTAKSYIITIWSVCLLPFVFLNHATVVATFVPMMLLMGQGIDYLIRSWYRLFPMNPYARVAGLLPLAVLVVAIGLSGAERFIYSYHYSPRAVATYPNDLKLVDRAISEANQPVTLLVSSQDKAFYDLYANHSKDKIFVTDSVEKALSSQHEVIAAASYQSYFPGTPTRIVVSSTAENANRFYVYKNTVQ